MKHRLFIRLFLIGVVAIGRPLVANPGPSTRTQQAEIERHQRYIDLQMNRAQARLEATIAKFRQNQSALYSYLSTPSASDAQISEVSDWILWSMGRNPKRASLAAKEELCRLWVSYVIFRLREKGGESTEDLRKLPGFRVDAERKILKQVQNTRIFPLDGNYDWAVIGEKIITPAGFIEKGWQLAVGAFGTQIFDAVKEGGRGVAGGGSSGGGGGASAGGGSGGGSAGGSADDPNLTAPAAQSPGQEAFKKMALAGSQDTYVDESSLNSYSSQNPSAYSNGEYLEESDRGLIKPEIPAMPSYVRSPTSAGGAGTSNVASNYYGSGGGGGGGGGDSGSSMLSSMSSLFGGGAKGSGSGSGSSSGGGASGGASSGGDSTNSSGNRHAIIPSDSSKSGVGAGAQASASKDPTASPAKTLSAKPDAGAKPTAKVATAPVVAPKKDILSDSNNFLHLVDRNREGLTQAGREHLLPGLEKSIQSSKDPTIAVRRGSSDPASTSAPTPSAPTNALGPVRAPATPTPALATATGATIPGTRLGLAGTRSVSVSGSGSGSRDFENLINPNLNFSASATSAPATPTSTHVPMVYRNMAMRRYVSKFQQDHNGALPTGTQLADAAAAKDPMAQDALIEARELGCADELKAMSNAERLKVKDEMQTQIFDNPKLRSGLLQLGTDLTANEKTIAALQDNYRKLKNDNRLSTSYRVGRSPYDPKNRADAAISKQLVVVAPLLKAFVDTRNPSCLHKPEEIAYGLDYYGEKKCTLFTHDIKDLKPLSAEITGDSLRIAGLFNFVEVLDSSTTLTMAKVKQFLFNLNTSKESIALKFQHDFLGNGCQGDRNWHGIMNQMEEYTHLAAEDCGVGAAITLTELKKQNEGYYLDATSCSMTNGDEFLVARSQFEDEVSDANGTAKQKDKEPKVRTNKTQSIPPLYRDLLGVNDKNELDCAKLKRHYLFFAAIRFYDGSEADKCYVNGSASREHNAKKGIDYDKAI